MTAKAQFTIAQCVPDPLTDERINFGVIVFAEGKTYSRFVSNWRRIASFAGAPTDYLQDFAEKVEELSEHPGALSTLSLYPFDSGSWLQRAVTDWGNSIQFTELRPSLDDPWRLLDRLAKRHLKGEFARQHQGRTRGQIAAAVYQQLERELSLQVGPARANHLAHRHLELTGHTLRKMKFDIGVMNGIPYGLGQAVSFQIDSISELRSNVGLATLMLEDAQRKHGALDLALVVAPPISGIAHQADRVAILEDARFSCRQFGAMVIEESDPSAWIEKVAGSVSGPVKSNAEVSAL